MSMMRKRRKRRRRRRRELKLFGKANVADHFHKRSGRREKGGFSAGKVWEFRVKGMAKDNSSSDTRPDFAKELRMGIGKQNVAAFNVVGNGKIHNKSQKYTM